MKTNKDYMNQHTTLEELVMNGEFLVVEDVNGNTVIIKASKLYEFPKNLHGTTAIALEYLIDQVRENLPDDFNRIMSRYDALRR